MDSITTEKQKSQPIESFNDNGDIGFNKLMYDRDIPGYNPRDLEYWKPFVDLAIDFYNKKHSKQYRVVELIRVIGCACSGFYFGMKFTATDSDSDSDSDADADVKTFGAEVYSGIEEVTVECVDIVVDGAILPVDTLRAHYF